MTESDIPSAYVRDKRTPPPSREELRARIPGWGVDLEPGDRPSYPKLQRGLDTGAHWDFPERQPGGEGREHSIEHAFVTPVFGTAQPLSGLSGVVRRFAYARFSEGQAGAGGGHRTPVHRRPRPGVAGVRLLVEHAVRAAVGVVVLGREDVRAVAGALLLGELAVDAGPGQVPVEEPRGDPVAEDGV